jgi:hypothetical protein
MEAARTRGGSMKALNVLVVEDEAPNRTRRALQAAGDGGLCAGGSTDQQQA